MAGPPLGTRLVLTAQMAKVGFIHSRGDMGNVALLPHLGIIYEYGLDPMAAFEQLLVDYFEGRPVS